MDLKFDFGNSLFGIASCLALPCFFHNIDFDGAAATHGVDGIFTKVLNDPFKQIMIYRYNYLGRGCFQHVIDLL